MRPILATMTCSKQFCHLPGNAASRQSAGLKMHSAKIFQISTSSRKKSCPVKTRALFVSTIRITGTFFWAWWKIGRDRMTSMALCGARSVKALSRRRSAPVKTAATRTPHEVTCFCQYCEAKAKERGINPQRARQGFLELAKFVDAGRQGHRPVDGYYVELWRLMLRYPELLAWEMLWTDSLRETYAAIYKHVKDVKPSLGVGWHICSTNSFNPIYRAEQDLAAIAPVSDFLKIVMYNNCAGERMAGYIESVHQTLYGDVPPQELLDFHYRVLNYQGKELGGNTIYRILGGLCIPRNQARTRRARRHEDSVMARNRHRYSNGTGSQ